MISRSGAELAPDDDAGLARQIGEGDERAFEALMRAHNRLLYRLARSILKDDAEAEDAVQEAYFAAYRNIGSFRGRAKLSTWLARIVINEAYARLRKQKRTGVVLALESRARSGERGEPRPQEGSMADETVERPDAAALRTELRRLLEAVRAPPCARLGMASEVLGAGLRTSVPVVFRHRRDRSGCRRSGHHAYRCDRQPEVRARGRDGQARRPEGDRRKILWHKLRHS
jgi:RNA polymerase sigma factor (sigma-70 family)